MRVAEDHWEPGSREWGVRRDRSEPCAHPGSLYPSNARRQPLSIHSAVDSLELPLKVRSHSVATVSPTGHEPDTTTREAQLKFSEKVPSQIFLIRVELQARKGLSRKKCVDAGEWTLSQFAKDVCSTGERRCNQDLGALSCTSTIIYTGRPFQGDVVLR